VLTQIAVTLTTHPVNFVQKTRRMKMTIKEAMQATIIGLIVSIPFIIEIVKELVK
jgi:biopolymer transport protein ExbB/TolQ